MGIVDTLEALLFVADSPSTVAQLAAATSLTEGQVEQGLEVLSEKLRAKGPLMLLQIAGGYQVCTRPEFAEVIARFLKPQGQKLSRTLMEVLAIVAYKQPVTLAEIDSVRGVQSDYGVRSLMERRLIRELGRRNAPGRPMLFGTTKQFLHSFNLNDLSQLPPLTVEPSIQPVLAFDSE